MYNTNDITTVFDVTEGDYGREHSPGMAGNRDPGCQMSSGMRAMSSAVHFLFSQE